MLYTATAKYIRTAPRKLRLVADLVRGQTPLQALDTLSLMPKRAAEPLSKVISSAIAAASQKSVKADGLLFAAVEVMEGPMLKRWQAVSRGSAHELKKRMTHIRIVLTDEKPKESEEGVKKQSK